ncbi:MAG: hypothetical protein JSS82_15590 [Bacteroidetes bacterium]|nr:hypothetical protein [Bacteroidota bacterium]
MNPFQLMAIQEMIRSGNLSMLPYLKQSMATAKPLDENAGVSQGNNAAARYMASRVAPVAASQAVADGPYASSFAMQRQADIGGAGALEAEQARQEAQNAEFDRQLKLHQIQTQDDEQNWQSLFGEGGPLSQYASSMSGGNYGGANMRSTSGAGGQQDQEPSGWEKAARIGTGVAQLGKQYMDAKAKGQQPIVAFGQGIGSLARDVVSAPSQLWGGIKSAFGRVSP